MSTLAVQILCAVLSITFAWSALAKFVRYRDWTVALAGYRLPAAVERAARVGVPVIELAVPGLFIAGNTGAGAALVVALVGAFSLAVLRARSLEGDRLPCGCFGKTKTHDYRLILVRNSSLGGIAALLLLAGEDVALFDGIGAPGSSEALPVTLSILGLLGLGWALWTVGAAFPEGPTLKRVALPSFVIAVLVIAALVVPLWSFGDTTAIEDSRDSRGLFDVRKVKVEGKVRLPRWTFVTFKAWTKERVYDRGYATVFIDTFDDARSDYYALIRSNGLEIQAVLMRDRKKKSDYEMGSLKAWKPGGAKVTVRVPFRRLKVPDSRLFYRWWAETLMTGEQCPRVCIDRVPDEGTVRMLLVETPEPTPTPTITPTPTPTPTPTASPTT